MAVGILKLVFVKVKHDRRQVGIQALAWSSDVDCGVANLHRIVDDYHQKMVEETRFQKGASYTKCIRNHEIRKFLTTDSSHRLRMSTETTGMTD